MPRRRLGLLRPLITVAVVLFLFLTPAGQHLFFAAADWFGRTFAHAIVHSNVTPSPKPK